jgi:serine protease Do
MHALRIIVGLVLVVCAAARPCFALEAAAVFKQADPSVVVIRARDRRGESQGSGVIVAPREVVTSCHVIHEMRTIKVFHANAERSAEPRYVDTARDLCQLHLDDELPGGKPVEALVPSAQLEVGQQVFVIGAPRGLEHTLSRGIVSALREYPSESARLIQTDASISPGSSGGGVFDQDGRLIGIVTFLIKESQNLNFAVPADWVAELPKRNRDRLAESKRAEPGQPVSAAAEEGPLRRGDTWRYRFSHRGKHLGSVSIEITDARKERVRERISMDTSRTFSAEREVDAQFNPNRIQQTVTLPGGYQLFELAPYFPSDIALKTGQTWSDIEGDFYFAMAGMRRMRYIAKIAGEDTVRVPAGEFRAWRMEVVSDAVSFAGTGAANRVLCTYWYASALARTVKMTIKVDSPIIVAQTLETYELVSFDPAR